MLLLLSETFIKTVPLLSSRILNMVIKQEGNMDNTKEIPQSEINADALTALSRDYVEEAQGLVNASFDSAARSIAGDPSGVEQNRVTINSLLLGYDDKQRAKLDSAIEVSLISPAVYHHTQ